MELKRLKSGQFQNLALFNFDGDDGWEPYGLVLDSAGNIYGATQIGGADDNGLIYELIP